MNFAGESSAVEASFIPGSGASLAAPHGSYASVPQDSKGPGGFDLTAIG
jgi:hypothetical protein